MLIYVGGDRELTKNLIEDYEALGWQAWSVGHGKWVSAQWNNTRPKKKKQNRSKN